MISKGIGQEFSSVKKDSVRTLIDFNGIRKEIANLKKECVKKPNDVKGN